MPEPKERPKKTEKEVDMMKTGDNIVTWAIALPIGWAVAFAVVSWGLWLFPKWWIS